jgi:hypothetical protein
MKTFYEIEYRNGGERRIEARSARVGLAFVEFLDAIGEPVAIISSSEVVSIVKVQTQPAAA